MAGSALTIVGGVFQRRGQARIDRSKRREDLGKVAAQKALEELISVRDTLSRYLADPDGFADGRRQARQAIIRAETATLAIPDSDELRGRLNAVFPLYNGRWWSGVVTTHARYSWKMGVATEAINLVSAFLRQEENLPAPSTWIASRDPDEVSRLFGR